MGYNILDIALYLKAIHNKDYSVVKTFRAAPSGVVLFFGHFFCSFPHVLIIY